MALKSNDLKSCPFCGKEVSMKRNMETNRFMVQCNNCHTWVYFAKMMLRKDAIEKWNTRAQ